MKNSPPAGSFRHKIMEGSADTMMALQLFYAVQEKKKGCNFKMGRVNILCTLEKLLNCFSKEAMYEKHEMEEFKIFLFTTFFSKGPTNIRTALPPLCKHVTSKTFSLDPPKEQFFGEAEHPRKVSQRRYHPTSFPLLSSANLLLFSKARNNIPGHLFRKIRGKAAFQKASCFISVTFTNTHMHGLKKEEGTLWEKLQCPYMDLNQVCASSPVRLMRPTSKGDLLCFL